MNERNNHIDQTAAYEIYEGYAIPLKNIKNVSAMREIIMVYGFIDSEQAQQSIFDEIQYMKADFGEEIMAVYDSVYGDDPACTVIANWLSINKELNPKRLRFEGLNTSSSYSSEWPDFIIFPDVPWTKSEDRTGITDEDAIEVLTAAAKELGIDVKQVGRYDIPL